MQERARMHTSNIESAINDHFASSDEEGRREGRGRGVVHNERIVNGVRHRDQDDMLGGGLSRPVPVKK